MISCGLSAFSICFPSFAPTSGTCAILFLMAFPLVATYAIFTVQCLTGGIARQGGIHTGARP